MVVVIGLAAVWLQMQANQAQRRVAQDQAIINAMQNVLQNEVDAETGQRGFIVTGDRAYLQPYSAAVTAVSSSLALLQSLIAATPANQQTLARLNRLSATKLSELASTIALRQTDGFTAARIVVEEGIGTRALDQIRAIERQLTVDYRQRLATESAEAEHRVQLTYAFVAAFGLCTVTLLAWAYRQIQRDLLSRGVMSKSLIHAANHDPLTQLPNRRFFYEWLSYALDQARREGRQAAVLSIDIDGFHAVNEFFGYERGNALLRAAAARLKMLVHAGDVLARIGGDEFALLIPVVQDTTEPATLAQQIIDALSIPFAETESLASSVSIGIAFYPEDAETSERLAAAADAAMTRAKHQGGNRYAFFPDNQNANQSRPTQIRADLFQCVENGQLTVHYQPIVDILGNIRSLEALVRWDHPSLGRISPQEFIPLAEQSGAIAKIDRHVRQTVIAQAALWRSAGLLVPIAVNMSALEFSASNLHDSLIEDLQAHQLDPIFLTLELVETALLKPETRQTMRRLQESGLNLVLDDFGTGFSSLSYLLYFPVSGLKIDRSFVMGLPGAEESRRLVEVILQMAATLKLGVVAEGVETAEQANWLRDHGCTRFQGYFFDRPMNATAISQRLQSQRGALQTAAMA